jgi:3-oxoacyl-[acyl-carrier protein] reductase
VTIEGARRALITGGGQGLGRGIALELARSSISVVLVQRSPAPLERTVAEIRSAGGEAHGVTADLRDPLEVTRAVEEARRLVGHVDILVNNAGSPDSYEPFPESSIDTWDSVVNLSLRAAYLCARASVQDMIERRWGRILNIGAIQATMPLGGNAAYAAAKGGVISLTRSMAVDLTQYGIIVNAIAPGPFDVRSPEAIAASPDDDWPTLLGRRGRPEELAKLAAFLVSDDCSFVIGQTIICDGGRTLARKAEPEPR